MTYKNARQFAWRQFRDKLKQYKRESTMSQIIWMGFQQWVFGDVTEMLPKGLELNDEEYEMLKGWYIDKNFILFNS